MSRPRTGSMRIVEGATVEQFDGDMWVTVEAASEDRRIPRYLAGNFLSTQQVCRPEDVEKLEDEIDRLTTLLKVNDILIEELDA